MKIICCCLLLLFVQSSIAATADCSATSINLPSLSLCVWDSNKDGIPDAAGGICPSGQSSVWARAYGVVNLTASCLSTSYFSSTTTTTATTSGITNVSGTLTIVLPPLDSTQFQELFFIGFKYTFLFLLFVLGLRTVFFVVTKLFNVTGLFRK